MGRVVEETFSPASGLFREVIKAFLNLSWRDSLDSKGNPLQQEEALRAKIAKLRVILRSWPWWSKGHLILGLSEFEYAVFLTDRARAARAISAARISAEAVIRIEGSPHHVAGKRIEPTVLSARTLQGLIYIQQGRIQQGLSILKHSLAINNAVKLPEKLRHNALESAASAALIVEDHSLAQEFLSRVPSAQLSEDGKAALRALRSGVTPAAS